MSTSSATMLVCEDLTFLKIKFFSFWCFKITSHSCLNVGESQVLPCSTEVVEERSEKAQSYSTLSQCVFFCLTYNVNFLLLFPPLIQFSTLLFLFLFCLPVFPFTHSALQAHRPSGLFLQDLWDTLCCPVLKPSHDFFFFFCLVNIKHCVVFLQHHLE